MDINDLRSLLTVLCLACFVGICLWAYSRGARAGFDEAARLPFTDDDAPVSAGGRHSKEG
ncbi:cbb3-type cytochrome c oxidase subunit 3 [Azoarcus sp. DN11]|uniref:cbb3-type cytochrome oxidase subunit 3 n=1 Tax=Azoarcus sp. DN11 TaxID=356837 RepID=UPI000EB33065|nr:cbb3-type cytochrome c oxidase subunit 3 [Azoarcus sp. DN11]AYH45030.1 CcoQ/FixQ family Cbb3-type cytochrome c oxidase assembly chaperone [Azoarcus sp. DN11]